MQAAPAASVPIKTETLGRLAIGCRASSLLTNVVTAFGNSDGPELLNTLVRSKDCQWIKAGTRYAVTSTAPSSGAREIKLVDDGTTWWVHIDFLSASRERQAPAAAADGPDIDNETIFNMAAMSASLQFARENCRGSADPNAIGAVAMVAKQDPAKMQAVEQKALGMVRQQAAKLGVATQCRNIADAYGPNGSVIAGAWLPARK
jgi:hypothetical protein